MSDLVGRLRIYGAVYDAELADQAADEIERMQKRVSDADECIEEQEEMLEDLQAEVLRLQKAYRPADMIEYQELVAENERLQAWKDEHSRTEGGECPECPYCEIDRLGDALERIERTILGTPDQFRAIAREALK